MTIGDVIVLQNDVIALNIGDTNESGEFFKYGAIIEANRGSNRHEARPELIKFRMEVTKLERLLLDRKPIIDPIPFEISSGA
jgi:hypothetical protein